MASEEKLNICTTLIRHLLWLRKGSYATPWFEAIQVCLQFITTSVMKSLSGSIGSSSRIRQLWLCSVNM